METPIYCSCARLRVGHVGLNPLPLAIVRSIGTLQFCFVVATMVLHMSLVMSGTACHVDHWWTCIGRDHDVLERRCRFIARDTVHA